MSSSPFNVLVVDDREQNMQALRAALDSDGASVATAETADAALQQLQRSDFALALVAARRPGFDGHRLAEQLRSTERGRQLPLVFIIDGAGNDDQLRSFAGEESGPVDYLPMPTHPRVLAARVRLFGDLFRRHRDMLDRMEEMKRLSRVNALMIGALSHDIRTPLAAVALNAELVIRRAQLQGLRQAGERIKAATATLGRQVDHLVNLSSLPSDDLRPEIAEADLAELARGRIDAGATFMLSGVDVSLQADGQVRGRFDPELISEAIDQLLLLAAIHGAGAPVRVQVDGGSRRALVLRVAIDIVLPEPACRHLFGGGPPTPGLPPSQVGPGLQATERIARVHGGSFVGRSREREGTLFELILPRSDD